MEPFESTPTTVAPRIPGEAADETRKVAIITGTTRGIGAGLADAYRRKGWAVVGGSRGSRPSEDGDMLIVDGDIAEPRTAERIIAAAYP